MAAFEVVECKWQLSRCRVWILLYASIKLTIIVCPLGSSVMVSDAIYPPEVEVTCDLLMQQISCSLAVRCRRKTRA